MKIEKKKFEKSNFGGELAFGPLQYITNKNFNCLLRLGLNKGFSMTPCSSERNFYNLSKLKLS